MSKAKAVTPTGRILAAIQKGWGAESAMMLDGTGCRSDARVIIPSGIEVLDGYVLGIGGWPSGRIAELFSDEGAGKTTIALKTCAEVQAMGGVAVYIDMEHALDRARAAACGASLADMLLCQPDTLEELLGVVETTLQELPAEQPAVIVWDSVAATMTEKEMEGGATGDDGRMLQVPAALSKRLRSIISTLSKTSALLLAINQTRSNPGVTFGDKSTTPGGNALKFYASVRVRILGGAKARNKGDEGDIVGKDVTLEAVKHKLAPPFKKARGRLLFGAPCWDNAWSTLGLAKDLGAVPEGLRGKDAHRDALVALNARADFATARKLPVPAPREVAK